MDTRKQAAIALFLSMLLFITVACGGLSGSSLPGMPDFAATDTQEALQSAGTPASPLSGNWAVSFDSSQAVFHIARDGSSIKSIDLVLRGWHCGGTTLTTTMQVRSSAWSISGNEFSATIDLNPPHIEELTFNGSYDEATQTWSGTWEGDEYGNHCGGKWEATR